MSAKDIRHFIIPESPVSTPSGTLLLYEYLQTNVRMSKKGVTVKYF
jgi:hypothetical protein